MQHGHILRKKLISYEPTDVTPVAGPISAPGTQFEQTW